MSAGILVAGGGTAALETIAALRALAGSEPRITMLAPKARFEQRATAVSVPFGRDMAPSIPFSEIARKVPFEQRVGGLRRVLPDRHAVQMHDGTEVPYDTLVIATGAVAHPAFPGATTFADVSDAPAVTAALDAARQVAFVVPTASGWSLPLYEMAMFAKLARPERDIAVVTAEPAPLWIFGKEAGEAIHDLFLERGIALLTGVRVLSATGGTLELDGGRSVEAGCAIALPILTGPALTALPHDDHGFLRVDAYGAVVGIPDVYAAGDVTAFPLKQGGLAAGLADTVAQSIAAKLGADVTPEPFRPVLRGLLLTGRGPLYLRSDGARGTSRRLPHAEVSSDALWWPPAKIPGRYLAPLVTGGATRSETEILDALQGAPTDDDDGGSDDVFDLALMLAREDAARGAYDQALRALESAEAMSERTLPPEFERSRVLWRARAAGLG